MHTHQTRSERAVALFNEASRHINSHSFKTALSYLQEAASVALDAGDTETSTYCMNEIAKIYLRFGLAVRALVVRKQLARILARTTSEIRSKFEPINEIETGFILWSMGNGDEALKHYEKALKLFRAARRRIEEADVLLNIGRYYAYTKQDPVKAIEYLTQAEKIAKKAPSLRGSILYEIGSVLEHRMLQLDKALSYYEKALKSVDESGPIEAQVVALISKGRVLRKRGHPKQALEILQNALALSNKTEDLVLKAHCLSSLGSFYLGYGVQERARQYFQSSYETIKRTHLPIHQMSALVELAIVNRQSGDPDKALELLEEALLIGKQLSDTPSRGDRYGEIYFLMGRILATMGREKESAERYELAYELSSETPMSYKHVSLGLWHMQSGDFDKAITTFRDLEGKCREDLAWRQHLCFILGNIGRSYWKLGDFKRSISYFMEALSTAEIDISTGRSEELRIGKRGFYDRLYSSTCEVLISWFKSDGNEDHLHEALRILELTKAREVTRKLETSEARTVALRKLSPKLQKIITEEKRLVQKLNTLYGADAIKKRTEIAKIMMQIQDLRTALWDHPANPCNVIIPSHYNPISRLNSIFEREPNAIIWEFIYDAPRDRLKILVLEKGDIHVFEKDNLHVKELEKLQNDFLKKYKSDLGQAKLICQELALKLGECLPPELIKLTESKSLLIIVPHGRLHLFSWESATPHNHQPLGLTLPIVKSYSLTLMQHSLEHINIAHKVVLVGNPNFNREDLNLVGADVEIDVLTDMLTQHGVTVNEREDVLVHERAHEDNLKRRLRKEVGIFHYAGHALLDHIDPWMSSIFLNDGEAYKRFTATQIAAISFVGSPLVVLSACETGESYVKRGDELIGLVRAFIISGATSIVATNWTLSDKVAPFFMACFYDMLFKGADVARALFKARKMTYQTSKSPVHWSVYSLYGNPFLRLEKS